jgi:peptide subunit release factor 1 (eRF1)
MLTEHDLQELLDFKTEHAVLSVYVNTDPALGNADVYKLKLRTMLKDVDLPEDAAAVEQYFEHEYDWSGRSVAVFSCAPEEFFRAYPIAIAVRGRYQISNRPHVKPLANLLDSFGGYGVVLVDKQGARLFSFHLGSLSEQEGMLGESVRRIKHGGGSQAAGRRSGDAGQTKYTEEVTDRNMREAAEFAAHFFKINNIRRVLIGGTDDNIALFRNQLPKAWQSLIVGTFPISMTASHKEVLSRAIEVGQDAEKLRETRLADAVITGAAKGRGGVVDLENTLGAIHEGRVQTLLILGGFRAPGFRCQACDYVTSQEMSTCPMCDGKIQKVPDAIDLAVRRVLRSGGEVEFLHKNQALADHGNIGALLRY